MKKKIGMLLCLSVVVLGAGVCAGQQKQIRTSAAAEIRETGEQRQDDQTQEPAVKRAGMGAAPAEAAQETAPAETESPSPTAAQEQLPIDIDTAIPIEKGTKIAVVVKSVDRSYWAALKKIMKEAVDKINEAYGFTGEDKVTMTFEGPKDDTDVTSQINIIDAVLAENPSVLCLAAIDVESCQAQLETARENGIPVVIVDSNISSDMASAYCGTHNYRAGRMAAQKLCGAIGKEGEVAIFAHEAYTSTSRSRVRGFRKTVKNCYDDMKVVSVSYRSREESLDDMVRNVLDAHPQLKGIFCTEDLVTGKVLQILKQEGRTDIKVVGFDSGSEQIRAIKAGTEYGTVVQDIYKMGYEAVWKAVKLAVSQDKEMEKIYIPHVWIDNSNLQDEANKKILYN